MNGLFITRTAAEIIWGYDDMLLSRLSSLLPKGMIKSSRVQVWPAPLPSLCSFPCPLPPSSAPGQHERP